MSDILSPDAVDRLLKAVEILSNNWDAGVKMGTKMQELIDGFGADRIVQRIIDSEGRITACGLKNEILIFPNYLW